jgi:ABC-2 type transport system ATP-binding protein
MAAADPGGTGRSGGSSAVPPPAPEPTRVRSPRKRRRDAIDDGAPYLPIRTAGLTKVYGDLVAVDALDLEVQPGEIFGLLGQNGAGKTTTILMLLGLTEPTSGRARVVGLDPARKPLQVKRQVGYLPDSVGFYGGLTGRQNLRYTAQLNGIPRFEAEARIDEVLEQVGLGARADTRTDTYSRGMLQRLGIADALVKDPAVLILDEPTTAIDPLGVVEILELLRSLAHERGIAILLSSHLLTQVQSVCDRVGIFASGRLIGVGTVGELAERFGDGAAHLEVGVAEQEHEAREKAASLIAGIAGVSAIQPMVGGSWRVEVRPATESAHVRSAAAMDLIRAGYNLTTVRAMDASLDDLYRHAVASMPTPEPKASEATAVEEGASEPKPKPKPPKTRSMS